MRGVDGLSRARTPMDCLLGCALFVGSFLLYLRTLAPSVATIFDDSLEFQLVCYQPGIAHPTGYPLYTLLGKLFTFLPVGDVAFRVNLMSAFFASVTVALLYATLRQLTRHQLPAILAGAVFAVSPVFWSQAVIAEVYTLNAAFVAAVLYLLLAWSGRSQEESAERTSPLSHPTRALSLLALVYGLSLTHHRTMLLLAPAAIVYIVLVDRHVFANWRLLARLALLMVAPLVLYLYLPLRGMTMSSLDGAYQNTLTGFLSYVAAGSYGIFLTEDPLAQGRELAFYAALLRDQFTWAGMVLAAVGLAYTLTRWRVALLLLLFASSAALFALSYRVPDVEVFLIPLFLVCALWIGMGIAALWDLIITLVREVVRREPAALRNGLYSCLLVCGAMLPIHLWQVNREQNDLSRQWEVHEYGVDVLSQPLEDDAIVIGILGEITLLNYFQQTEGLRPNLTTIPADTEEERLAAVREQMERGLPVYLTRPLSGAEERYHLSSVGPLIRVRERPPAVSSEPSYPLSISFGESILLRGCDHEIRQTRAGPQLRLRLHWLATDMVAHDYKVSLRLLNPEGHLAAVHDSFPVRDAYRTDAWRPGEIVLDTHDLPILAGVPPGDYVVHVTMYEPATPATLASAAVSSVSLAPTLGLGQAGPWDVEHRTVTNLGGRMTLLGYSLIGSQFRPGDHVPLTFLWQGLHRLDEKYILLLWLDDGAGWPESQAELLLSGRYPPADWQPGEVVRDWQSFLIPGNTQDGSYRLRMQVRAEHQALPRLLWRLPVGNVLDLGPVQIEGRERSFQPPSLEHPLEAQLGESVRLLGYDLVPTEARPGDTLDLTLYWQGLALMDTSYSVFVHLLDQEGQILAQRDSVPGGGALPTTGWAEGEVVTDAYEIPIPYDAPTGVYSLTVGIYDPVTGVRLPALDEEGEFLGDHVELAEVTLSSP